MFPNSIELLSPAGNYESVIAAVSNGADAVYIGHKMFSARQNATNFDNNDLREMVLYCHARGVLVYLALNTIIYDHQVQQVIDVIKLACSLGIDAIIAQDLAVARLVKEICPSINLHASTQMAIHTIKGATLLKQYGFKRVVLARELTFKEIQDIIKNVDIETEVFVHGALCMSFSGQCYISAMIGGRSGNRGNCAGTCRLPFSSTKEQGYELSLKDNCLANHINKLIEAGVTSMKIEGRMKRPEYVAAATQAYNNAKNNQTPDIELLKNVFSRSGFTDGYFTDKIDEDMFGYRQKQDVVSATNKLLKQLSNSYKKEKPRISIDFSFTAKQNEEITLVAIDKNNNQVTIKGDVMQKAINSPTTKQSIEESLAKLGGTIFFANKINIDIDKDLMIPKSVINDLRRKATDSLFENASQIKPHKINDNLPHIKQAVFEKCLNTRARFEKVEQIPFEQIQKLEFLIIPIDEIIKNQEKLADYKDKIIIEPYRIMLSYEQEVFKKLKDLKQIGYENLMASNLAHIQISKELGFNVFGDAFLNCINSYSANELYELGVKDLTLSFEGELAKLNKIKSPIKTGIIAYGYMPLMIMKNCPIKQKINCKDCGGNKSLKDRYNISFKVICNNKKYSEVLNSSPIYLADRLDEVGQQFITLYFTTEEKQKVKQILKQYQNKQKPVGSYTRGLYYRSI